MPTFYNPARGPGARGMRRYRRNADDRARGLARAAAGGDPHAELQHLRELTRSGELPSLPEPLFFRLFSPGYVPHPSGIGITQGEESSLSFNAANAVEFVEIGTRLMAQIMPDSPIGLVSLEVMKPGGGWQIVESEPWRDSKGTRHSTLFMFNDSDDENAFLWSGRDSWLAAIRTARPVRHRPNPDKRIRDLERSAAAGDEHAARRLRVEKGRSGLLPTCPLCHRRIGNLKGRNRRPLGRTTCSRPSRPSCWGVAKNPDDSHRRLERAAAGGDLDAQAGVLVSLIRQGRIRADHVESLAALGDPAAELAVGKVGPVSIRLLGTTGVTGQGRRIGFLDENRVGAWGPVWTAIAATSFIEVLQPEVPSLTGGEALLPFVHWVKKWIAGGTRGCSQREHSGPPIDSCFWNGASRQLHEEIDEFDAPSWVGYASLAGGAYMQLVDATDCALRGDPPRFWRGAISIEVDSFAEDLWRVWSHTANALSLKSGEENTRYGLNYKKAMQDRALANLRPWIMAGSPDTWIMGDYHPNAHECRCEDPDATTCGNCGTTWCDRCDPGRDCHVCAGYGYTSAEIYPNPPKRRRPKPIGPIDVCCHMCHSDPGQECRWPTPEFRRRMAPGPEGFHQRRIEHVKHAAQRCDCLRRPRK